MKNKTVILAIAGGLLISAALIAWLVFGGSGPMQINAGKGITAQVNSSMKNSLISRERDGKKLWEFTIAEAVNDDAKKKTLLKGVKGRVYRSDGSYIDVKSDGGTMLLAKDDFTLQGHVWAQLSTGGTLLADKVNWLQKQERLTATGHVKLEKDGWVATGDKAVTGGAFKKLTMTGKAKLEKGGEADDK